MVSSASPVGLPGLVLEISPASQEPKGTGCMLEPPLHRGENWPREAGEPDQGHRMESGGIRMGTGQLTVA